MVPSTNMAQARPAAGAGPWRATLGAAILMGAGALAGAAEMESPQGPVLLTVEGAIGRHNRDGAAAFDLAMLDGLPQVSFATSTTWTEGVRDFSGPTLRSVLDAAGAQGAQVAAVALNDYRMTVPLSEVTGEAPIIATRIDGAEFGVRDKGPLWIVYPYDSSVEFQTEVIFGRSVWQLVRLEVSD
jgi:hypothetical protein